MRLMTLICMAVLVAHLVTEAPAQPPVADNGRTSKQESESPVDRAGRRFSNGKVQEASDLYDKRCIRPAASMVLNRLKWLPSWKPCEVPTKKQMNLSWRWRRLKKCSSLRAEQPELPRWMLNAEVVRNHLLQDLRALPCAAGRSR